MKNLKSSLSLVLVILISAVSAYAQEFKLAKNTGRLEIREVNNVTIEGYSGNEIIFSSNVEHDDDGRSKGLRAISSLGVEDNTGLGLSVTDKGNVVEVRQLKKMDGPDVTIKVPKGVTIFYFHSSPYGDNIKLSNLDNPVEVSTVHNGVILENVTGPLNIKTIHGDIDAWLTGTVKSPIEIKSDHGHVDITLPTGTKADIKLETSHGEIFVDPGLKLEFNHKGGDDGDEVSGKINGGGLEFNLRSEHGNIYVRQK